MAIGSYGRRVFSTSDSRILTFRDFTYTTAARYADHEIIGSKPKTEYLGPGLDGVTFTITLRADMSIDVRRELEAWRKMAGNGSAERLIIGKKRLGRGRWCLTECSEAWYIITNRGGIMSASLDVKMREYV